ncbi:hypothetical protein PR202_ga20331 [Eleusine coracana subsp. coracana]|uniref:F-box domain-containing protein n=1 Tax=Eleusine coracana subsp. coracana TaxID=191504 RepID=A0AAV5CXL9_ELECO|nr:hypothetical protein PR202_ga20331 [Eleusine coracana subsp. coracana]
MAASLPDDLIPDILVLIPPEEPACLVLASAVCKAWRRIVTDPAFSGRYRALHRTPPMLGFFHNPMDIPMEDKAPSFVPTTSFRLPTPDRRMRHMFDCHHGRVLLYNYDFESPTQGFNIWDPLTDDQHIIPDVPDMFTKGAVVCTAASGGCHHRSCSAGPFIVAFAGVNGHGDAVHADFYSSETREWSLELYIYVGDGFELKEDRPAVFVGDSLYFVGTSGFLVRYWYSPLLRLVTQTC